MGCLSETETEIELSFVTNDSKVTIVIDVKKYFLLLRSNNLK